MMDSKLCELLASLFLLERVRSQSAPNLQRELPMTVRSPAGPLRGLGPAARWCLTAGVVEHPLPVPGIESFRNESDLIFREGLAPVALQALDSRLTSPNDPLWTCFRDVTRVGNFRCFAVDVLGATLLSTLSKAGIPTVVIKGPAVARLHPKGWPRHYSDIDILVPKQNFLRAVLCSKGEGFEYSERTVPQWRWFDLVCREGLNLHSASGGNIDIHHHVPPWALSSKFEVNDVINRSIPWELCGIPINIASPEDLLLVSTLHVLNDLWKGKSGLSSWRDVIVVMKLLGASKSAMAFDGAGLGWLFELVAKALSVAVPEIGIVASDTEARIPVTARWRMAALGWGDDSALSRHRLSWAIRLPTPNALAYLAGTAFPAPKYIRERHGSLRNYWRSAWNETIATRHGSDYRMTTVQDKTQ